MITLNLLGKIFKPRLELMKGSRFISFAFVFTSVLIAAGVLFAANMYYDIDTGEVVVEQMQRVTQLLKAPGGLVVGATATTTNDMLEVNGSILTGRNGQSGQLKIYDDTTDFVVSLSATNTMGADLDFYMPSEYSSSSSYYLTTNGNGSFFWMDLGSAGLGTITAVGDISSNGAFDGSQGTTLWFEGVTGGGDANEIALTSVDPTADATITLPQLTGTVVISSGSLSDGGILFANNGFAAQDVANLFWSTSSQMLGIGTSSPEYLLDVKGAIRSGGPGQDGQLRIYSDQATDYEVVFNATDTMSTTTVYYLPPDYGTNAYVLTTNGSGVLTWTDATGISGAIDGAGTANRLAVFTDGDTIASSSIADYYTTSGLTLTATGTTGDIYIHNELIVEGVGTSTFGGNLLVSNTFSAVSAILSGSVYSPLFTNSGSATFTSGATTTISSGGGENIYLDPASGIIKIAAGDVIETDGGYQIGASGDQILREMIPIFGFDLPVQCATTCRSASTTISRTIEAYPFSPAATGTTRVHKFVIRYADNMAAASSSSWDVYNITDPATHDNFTLDGSASGDLAAGEATTTGTVIIPTDGDDWRLDIKLPSGTSTIKIYQIFLAAYDQIN